jgi:Flp pilus assembly protein TadB
LFRRTRSEPAPQPADDDDSAGRQRKGRPTPSRREAEARNKQRAKVPRTRKERAAARRLSRAEGTEKMREAMRTGDDRYLPARDRGPERRFIRDFVDSKFIISELMIPLMLVVIVLGWSGNATLVAYANVLLLAMLLVMVVDLVRMRFQLRGELRRRFPEESHRGATLYAVMRAVQMRPFRKPDRQVKVGQRLPDRYR